MEAGAYLFLIGCWLYSRVERVNTNADAAAGAVVASLATLVMLRAGWLLFCGLKLYRDS